MLRKEEFKHYRHPFENDLFENLLMHEMGHTNGLMHDFSASTEGDLLNFSSSLMDYPPFPVVFLRQHLERRDLARLRAMYLGVPYLGYDGCSDEMEQSGTEINCQKGDWSKPEIWYTAIVATSPKGVFETVVEQMSGLPTRDYLSILVKFFTGNLTASSQKNSVQKFLCIQENHSLIQDTLHEKYGFKLLCQ